MTNQSTPDTDTTRVVIKFTRTVERECPYCKGTGMDTICMGFPCTSCGGRTHAGGGMTKGTGKVRVRVSGDVEVVEWGNITNGMAVYNLTVWQQFTPFIPSEWISGLGVTKKEAKNNLADKLVKAHLAGKLPAEIASKIREESL